MRMNEPTRRPVMATEAAEAPLVAQRQIERCGPLFEQLGSRLRRLSPRLVVTCARGSSDHATAYGKYLIEPALGCAVASVGPSIASVYESRLDLDGALFVAVSQSGRSPDLLSLTQAARDGGALVVGFINDETSPLFDLCEISIPLCAGAEVSVAATKSYIASGLAFLQLAAHWTDSADLKEAVRSSPAALETATGLDWWPALARLEAATSLYVIGRGVGLGAASEMALKFKETCRLHAEAFSSAEVMHGPLALVRPDFPVVALSQDDESAEGIQETIARLVELKAAVLSTWVLPGTTSLPIAPNVAAVLSPLCQIQSFYMAIWRLALARGLDPDSPDNLRKVTETT
jgi:glucosamine--fructose-6-phosphate aminotransferase (isomerizing)